uniref:Ribosomal protein L23 n=1 Tax=Fagopyrum dibotrys TaxID=516549 RepID=A0A481YIU6_9CARY|nr:ribosomal protein L23 [Fagopyrum dibotrys]
MDRITYAIFTDKSIRLVIGEKSIYFSCRIRINLDRNKALGRTLLLCQGNSYEWSSTPPKGSKNGTYYGTYNVLQTYDHYASTGLFYSTS